MGVCSLRLLDELIGKQMRQVCTAAVFNQQMLADQIWKTGTVLEAIMSGHWPAWGKFGASEEIAELLKGSTVLQGDAHQTGHYVIETDDLRCAVGAFHSKEEFGWLGVVINAEVERALSRDTDFLGE
jgi:hypothetical protein